FLPLDGYRALPRLDERPPPPEWDQSGDVGRQSSLVRRTNGRIFGRGRPTSHYVAVEISSRCLLPQFGIECTLITQGEGTTRPYLSLADRYECRAGSAAARDPAGVLVPFG